MSFDPILLRQQFSILNHTAHGQPLIYLDNAATSQKPEAVLTAIVDYYRSSNANVHRGSHYLSDKATNLFEDARKTVAKFINAAENSHIIWSKGTTEAINMVAYGLEAQLKEDDEILISSLEHHANLVPWQQLAQRTKAKLVILPLSTSGQLLGDASQYFTSKTKIFACTQVSNAFGCQPDINYLLKQAQGVGAYTLVDGAQAVAHHKIDVSQLDCDFYVFSSHKMYGPTGIGVLYGKTAPLELLTPYQTGGEMVAEVSYETTSFNQLPYRLEAGTPHIEGAIGLAAACEFLQKLDRKVILEWEQSLANRAYDRLSENESIQLYSPNDSTMVSFSVVGVSSADISAYLDSQGIAVRSGRHCAHPAIASLGVSGTIRASFACYNTLQEADRFCDVLFDAIELLADD